MKIFKLVTLFVLFGSVASASWNCQSGDGQTSLSIQNIIGRTYDTVVHIAHKDSESEKFFGFKQFDSGHLYSKIKIDLQLSEGASIELVSYPDRCGRRVGCDTKLEPIWSAKLVQNNSAIYFSCNEIAP